MSQLRFDNRFVAHLRGDDRDGGGVRQVHGALWSAVNPTPVPSPHVLAISREMLATLGIGEAEAASAEFAAVFGGNALLDGMRPYASNYGGHQFGHWAGQLGDGRAIMLGEVIGASGQRWELQLKGAGPTPYSRTADGRAVLRSSIREFICSEAMHHLGVPTTRALSLVATGDDVVRDMFYDGRAAAEPGAVVCRVAPSFIRFGHFELPASRGDLPLLQSLVRFCIGRDYPHIDPDSPNALGDWFAEICERTAVMVGHWMRVGFVHGVMNTDNMSILGLTIDYGPYGWVDNYDPDWTPNTTDAQHRRYRFGQQAAVAYWNLGRLAGALASLEPDAAPFHAGLARYVEAYEGTERENAVRKLGLGNFREGDVELMRSLEQWMRDAEVDMTLFFRGLAAIDPESPMPDTLTDAFYNDARSAAAQPTFQDWLGRYRERVRHVDRSARREQMRLANPLYVPRNYLVQQVIDRATAGDPSGIAELLDVLRRPYDERPGRGVFAGRRPDWARDKPGCSTLSCSS
ncbi:protein adenylyltransferase SelO [Cognatilysobacter lacus]|uniref:Protein nucleotidyltransferase YdiU n=1 Tax=Cognatilysobacter lacus TaxID=1643323 RepID=A0A5D8Z069_9GAMM|nr:YdiU family protein [Lysobacter lacus]TZF88077.1 YdiU family protein [Lysobacter lacus]